jgi:nucleoside-diphosphate-sugar epimerase
MELVLVTGASGFLASHIIKQLLDEGYRVRGTVRNLKDEKKCAPLKLLASENSKHALELCEADLMNEESWLQAVKECTHVVHVASPVPNYVPKDENEVIKPAVNGTLFVLKACVQTDSRVKHVVLTSSVAAVAGDDFHTGKVYTENDFSQANVSQPYTKRYFFNLLFFLDKLL